MSQKRCMFLDIRRKKCCKQGKKPYIPIRSYIAASTRKTHNLRNIYTKTVLIRYFACHPRKSKQPLSVMYACSGQCASTCSISPLTNSLLSFRIIKSLFSFISFGKAFLSKKRFFIILSGGSFLMSKRTLWPLDVKNKDFRLSYKQWFIYIYASYCE